MRLPIFLLLCATTLFSCKEKAPVPAYIPREENPANWRAVDSLLPLVRSGDLALRTGADATSTMLRQMNLKNKTYSHCGIVLIEGGYPFVYHAIGGEDNPDARLRRDSARNFFHPQWNERMGLARLDLDTAQLSALRRAVYATYRRAPLFDMDFDLATDDKLYCAEFVYKTVCAVAGDTAYLPRTTLSRKCYVGVDNLYENPHARIVRDYRFR